MDSLSCLDTPGRRCRNTAKSEESCCHHSRPCTLYDGPCDQNEDCAGKYKIHLILNALIHISLMKRFFALWVRGKLSQQNPSLGA